MHHWTAKTFRAMDLVPQKLPEGPKNLKGLVHLNVPNISNVLKCFSFQNTFTKQKFYRCFDGNLIPSFQLF